MPSHFKFPLRHAHRGARAFTLVELLVVVVIIGVIMSLLLPTMQTVRETGRATVCRNHLKELATGCRAHVTAHGIYPTDGWGFKWIGDPDRGFGRRQPGGWLFDVLPYIDQQALHDLGKGQSGSARSQAIRTQLTTPVDLFYCPTRRSPGLYQQRSPDPSEGQWEYNHPDDPGYIQMVVKCDYSANKGDNEGTHTYRPGPNSASGHASYDYPDSRECTGLFWWATEYTDGHVRDGQSITFMLGEEAFDFKMVEQWRAGDPQNAYIGHDPDNSRLAGPEFPLIADFDPTDGRFFSFGGPHQGGCFFAFCDGRVDMVTWAVDLEVLGHLANRADDQEVSLEDF